MSPRPSPALVVAVLVLVAALAGTALAAGPDASSSAPSRAKVKKIARKQASKLLAENPSPSASAFIEADGDVGAAPPPTNIASADVTAPTTGARCFQLPFAPRTGAGNSLADIQDDTVISMDLVPPFIACPADAEAEVRTTDAQTGIENEAFFIQFDK